MYAPTMDTPRSANTGAPAWIARGTRFREIMKGDAMASFMRVCPERAFRPGDFLFRQGESATQLHVIATGQVKLAVPTATGHERVIAVVGPEDMIGEAFVLDEPVYRVDAVALTEVQSCPMNHEQFLTLTLEAPDFVLRFANLLATSLIRCRETLSHTFDPVKIRIAKVLLDQAKQFGSREAGAEGLVTLQTKLRHEDIASLASATRVSASMAIAELREIGVIDGSRGHYRIDLEGLGRYVEDPA
jgi:CRP/FNR family transcriptional regulator, cyclic AMP receptor protein